MARMGPDTAQASFSIVIGDQPEMDFGGRRNPDGQGFAVFGRVTAGMDVVGRIHQSHTGAFYLLNTEFVFSYHSFIHVSSWARNAASCGANFGSLARLVRFHGSVSQSNDSSAGRC